MGTGEEQCERLGTACRADLEGCETPFMCSVKEPLGWNTIYCRRERGLIHQELDLWNQFYSLIYIYISRTSLTVRGAVALDGITADMENFICMIFVFSSSLEATTNKKIDPCLP